MRAPNLSSRKFRLNELVEKKGVPCAVATAEGMSFPTGAATGLQADCGMTWPGKTHFPAWASASVLQPSVQ